MAFYDFVVVGAGLFGATLSRELTDRGMKVLVVDKADHVGGACFTEEVEGVVVHRYGPHVFHTNDSRIWAYVNRFAEFRQFMVRTKALYQGAVYSLPFNLMTFQQLWGVSTPAEAKKKLEAVRIPIEHPATIEEWALSQLGEEIYSKFIRDYTKKQWGRDAGMLPAAILKRLPFRLTFDDNYFDDKYQGVPVGGYTPFFLRMLEGIEVKLECDYLENRSELDRLGKVVYSGRVDALFDYSLGELEFRTCRFDTKILDGDYQGNPVIHYVEPQDAFTRVVEHKHFEKPSSVRSPVTWEYPEECGRGGKPFYPINDTKNQALYERYAAIPSPIVLGGRLGKYRYVDMHQVIAQAWAMSEKLA